MTSADDSQPAADHDVLVQLRLSNRSMGTASERQDVEALTQQLEDAVVAAAVGDCDGSEIGAGECTLFFAGPDADRLFAVLQPLLRRHPLGRGAKVTLQRGEGEPTTQTV